MNSQDIARVFKEIADILAIKGENPFRIRAYEKAAQNIESLGDELFTLIKEDKLTSVPGIGADLANKIKEIAESGKLKAYEDLKKEIPPGVLDMLKIPGLGPKTVHAIYQKLKIDTIEKLENAAKKGTLAELEGVRVKTMENILKGIELIKKGGERTPLYFAANIAQEFLSQLKKVKEVDKIEAAGSLRRKKETIRDIDILVTSEEPAKVMDTFTSLSMVKRVLAKGETKSSVIAQQNNMQVDLRVVEKNCFGSALLYFTGSKQFNIKMRQLAIKKGYKINEYGVFKGEMRLAGKTEEEIFSLLKMAYVAPELREDRGEVEAALKDSLPKLVELKDIKGDLHVHSTYSDGTMSIEKIANTAKDLGYEYIAVTDHSQTLKIAHGMDIKAVHKKIEELNKLNKKLKGIRVLCGMEVDILSDGKLDYPDSLLKELDIVVAAIHSGFKQSREQLTARTVAACKSKYVHIISHPTGRLWPERDAYDIDLEEVNRAARDNKVALEINCYHNRLDLNDSHALAAKHAKVKLALGTDAHILEQFRFMGLGVSVARRAWLEKKDVINCMKLEDLLKWLKK
ncbi:MAG: DNA polymerase/3'-5' exonuclease PolX [Candidatus Omnitrophota bacterium]|nr:MAG: DNA polymerase/3'-5' exonuclease PolX [Candidatus Omnitrophota bacterium]